MIRLLFKWALGLVSENIGWKLLALASAVAIWALVASEPQLSTFALVPVEYKNLPDDLEISSNPVSSVLLELRGPSGELRNMGETGVRPQVIFDMATALPGEHTYSIDDGAVRLPRGVRLVRAIPSEARFDFEKRASRTVPVVVRIAGAGHEGYYVSSEAVSPSRLTIVGPASHVARTNEVQTDPVDVSTVVGTSQFRVNASVEDPFVRLQTSPQVEVTVTMKKR